MSFQNGAFWFNQDGLFIPFGRNEATQQQVGEFCYGGDLREVHAVIDFGLLAGGAETILSESVRLPVGAVFQDVRVHWTEVGAGGTSFDLGLIELDRSTHSASADADGLIAAYVVADMDLGAVDFVKDADSTPAGVTGGALIAGAVALTVPCLLTVTTVGTFTTGIGRFVIRYHAAPTSGQVGN
jgi:hypothetical protein